MRLSLRIWNIAPFLLLVLVLLGCNENEDKHVNKTYSIVIQQMKFTPASLTVNKGDTIIWTNKDIVEHNVTDKATKEWASPNLSPGMSWSKVITTSATYVCTIHPVMKGSLQVR
jgi:plastocyanin